jgi:hypothetical protein
MDQLKSPIGNETGNMRFTGVCEHPKKRFRHLYLELLMKSCILSTLLPAPTQVKRIRFL